MDPDAGNLIAVRPVAVSRPQDGDEHEKTVVEEAIAIPVLEKVGDIEDGSGELAPTKQSYRIPLVMILAGAAFLNVSIQSRAFHNLLKDTARILINI